MDFFSTLYSRTLALWARSREPMAVLFGNWLIWLFFGLAVAANALVWALVYFLIGRSTGLVALHYQVDFGVNLLGQSRALYAMPALGLLAITVNVVVASGLVRVKDGRFLGLVLLVGALIVNIYLIAAAGSLSFINSN